MNVLAPIQGDPPIPRRKLDVAEYYRMAEVGILRPDDRVELIEGELIEMAPSGPEHASVVSTLMMQLVRRIGESAIVRADLPIRLDDFNEPEPDFALVRPRPDRYRSAHPGPADVLLVIEVAKTSLAFDRGAKMRLYAGHGIPEYWVLDLDGRRLERFLDPRPDGYARMESMPEEAEIAPQALPGVRLRLADILG